jgi:hypothetical protein
MGSAVQVFRASAKRSIEEVCGKRMLPRIRGDREDDWLEPGILCQSQDVSDVLSVLD